MMIYGNRSEILFYSRVNRQCFYHFLIIGLLIDKVEILGLSQKL